MNYLKILLIYSPLILIVSCGNNNSTNKVSLPAKYELKTDTLFSFDTTNKTQNQRLLRLMAISCLKQFDKERTDLIESDMDNVFQVGEIQKKGSTYQYEVTSKEFVIGIKYSCTPNDGLYTKYMVGTDSIVKVTYKNAKIGQTWDECHRVNSDESCSATKQIELYPVKTYFKLEYVKIDNSNSQFTLFRKHIPQILNN